MIFFHLAERVSKANSIIFQLSAMAWCLRLNTDPHAAVPVGMNSHRSFETQMSKHVRRATSLVALVCATTLAAVWVFTTFTIASGRMQIDGSRPRGLATSADIDSTWRHTKFGWQDSARWPVADSFAPVKTIELLHPFVWAGIVLFAVIGTMIWASSEWEIARLFGSDEAPAE